MLDDFLSPDGMLGIQEISHEGDNNTQESRDSSFSVITCLLEYIFSFMKTEDYVAKKGNSLNVVSDAYNPECSLIPSNTSASGDGTLNQCPLALEEQLLSCTKNVEELLSKVGDRFLSKDAIRQLSHQLDGPFVIQQLAIQKLSYFLPKQPEILSVIESKIDLETASKWSSSLLLIYAMMQYNSPYKPDDKILYQVGEILSSEINAERENLNLTKLGSMILSMAAHQGSYLRDIELIDKIFGRLSYSDMTYELLLLTIINLFSNCNISNNRPPLKEAETQQVRSWIHYTIMALYSMYDVVEDGLVSTDINKKVDYSYQLLKLAAIDNDLGHQTKVDIFNLLLNMSVTDYTVFFQPASLIIKEIFKSQIHQIALSENERQKKQDKINELKEYVDILYSDKGSSSAKEERLQDLQFADYIFKEMLGLGKVQYTQELVMLLCKLAPDISLALVSQSKFVELLEYLLLNNPDGVSGENSLAILMMVSPSSSLVVMDELIDRLAEGLTLGTSVAFLISLLEEQEQLIKSGGKLAIVSISKLSSLLASLQSNSQFLPEIILNKLISNLILLTDNQVIDSRVIDVLDEIVSGPSNSWDLLQQLRAVNKRYFGTKEDFVNSLAATYNKEIQGLELSSREKSVEQIWEEIKLLNASDQEFIDLIEKHNLISHYTEIIVAFNTDSSICAAGRAICDWNEDNVTRFAQCFKAEYAQLDNLQYMHELLAVIKQASILSSGNDPRAVQMIAVLLYIISEEKGRLLQISTGEGKSTITAMLAAFYALHGRSVDIITSSAMLAVMAAEDSAKRKFFHMLSLSVSHNTAFGSYNAVKECYKADIVYGDVGNFQFDLLNDYKYPGLRCGRIFDIVIVDEVDSMFIDESSKIAMISSHLPGSEYLQLLYSALWHQLSFIDNHIVKQEDDFVYVDGEFKVIDGKIELAKESQIYPIENIEHFRTNILKDYGKNLLMSDKVVIPSHLKTFASNQLDAWTKSALAAKALSLDKDYVILSNIRGKRVIAPVDYDNTGVIHNNTQWTDALHQFVQLKSGLSLTGESLITSYISNMGYFKLYGKNIFGMSGTLGSRDEQELLKKVYDVDIQIIPTYKEKNFKELPTVLTYSEEVHLAAIVKSVMAKTAEGRATLVICETISHAQDLSEFLKRFVPARSIKLYNRSDDRDTSLFADYVDSGGIIISTNLAGRGIDLKTTQSLEANGGLHVIVTYLPKNIRVEDQAFGRTSRQGNFGTAELIINVHEALNSLGYPGAIINDISELKYLRDSIESDRLLKAILQDRAQIDLEDELYNSYLKLYLELQKSQDHRQKLNQLEEDWGIVLKNIKHSNATLEIKLPSQISVSLESKQKWLEEQTLLCKENNQRLADNARKMFKEFEVRSRQDYSDTYKIMKNPSYVVRDAINNMGKDGKKAIELLEMAINLDSNFSFPAYYNKALTVIQQNSIECAKKNKAMTEYHAAAYNDLQHAKAQMEHQIIPHFEQMIVLSTHIGDNDLLKQVKQRIDLYRLYIEHIDKVCYKLLNCESGNWIEVSNVKLLKDFYPQDEIPHDEIMEFNYAGLITIFDVREVEPRVDLLNAVIVGAFGIIQIAVGAYVGLACSFTGSMAVATSLIISGISDIGKAINIAGGEAFAWNSYITEKAITASVTLAVIGIAQVATFLKVPLLDPASMMGVPTAKAALLVNVASQLAVNKLVDIAEHQAARNIEKEYRQQIIKEVSNSVNNGLDREEVRNDLSTLLALDALHGDNKNFLAIQRFVCEALDRKESAYKRVFGGVISQLGAKSDSTSIAGTVLKVGSVGYRLTNIASAVGELSNITDKLCEDIAAHIHRMATHQGDIANYIAQHMNPMLGTNGKAKAEEIVTYLTLQGIIKGGRLQADQVLTKDQTQVTSANAQGSALFKLSLTSLRLTKEVERSLKEKLATFCQLQAHDHATQIQHIKHNTSTTIQAHISNNLKSKVLQPLMSLSATDKIRQQMTSELNELGNSVISGTRITSSDLGKAVKNSFRLWGAGDNKQVGQARELELTKHEKWIKEDILSQEQERLQMMEGGGKAPASIPAGAKLQARAGDNKQVGRAENKAKASTKNPSASSSQVTDYTLFALAVNNRNIPGQGLQKIEMSFTPEEAQHLEKVFAATKSTATKNNHINDQGKAPIISVKPGIGGKRYERAVDELGLPIATGGDTVRTVALANEQYQQFINKYPFMSELMPVIRVGGVTILATMVSGPVGGAAAFNLALRGEVMALAVSSMAGEEIGEGVKHATEKLAGIIRVIAPEVSQEEAIGCASGVLAAAMVVMDVKGTASQVKTATKAAGTGAKASSIVLKQDIADGKPVSTTASTPKTDTKPSSAKLDANAGSTKVPVSKVPIKEATTDLKPTKVDVPIKLIYGDKSVKIGEHEFPLKPVSSMEKLSKPTKQGPLYQQKVAELYSGETKFSPKYDSKVGDILKKGEADYAFLNAESNPIAVEAKYIDKWDKSPYNPNYTKDRPFLINEKADVLTQARKYQNSDFHEIIYHTNSPEFAAFYKELFQKERLTKIRVVISPVELIRK